MRICVTTTIEAMASPLLSYSEAAGQIQRYIQTLGEGGELPALTEVVPLDRATGRVLAEAIYSDRDQPPFPRSTRDGYACRAAEASSHRLLALTGHVRAGEAAPGTLGSGEVWEIMTGAAVPEGADAVFMVEHSEHDSGQASGSVRLLAPRTIEVGENIVPRGAEAHAGNLLVAPGTRIASAQIALAAQCGYSQLQVAPRPRVAILSTGDELVSVDSIPGPIQIRNSNSPMLAALVTTAGGEPIVLPAVPDQEEALDAVLRQILTLGVDMLLITGGISMGRFDLVEDALKRANARFVFAGVAIQPGKPVAFGQIPATESGGSACIRPEIPVLALPGNPISSAVTFHLFAAPILAALGRNSDRAPRFALARMAHDFSSWRGKSGLTRFLPARCNFEAGFETGLKAETGPEVQVLAWHGSGDIATFARCNCFLVVPPDCEEVAQGSMVRILLI